MLSGFAAAGPPSEFGGQGHAVVDFLGPPPVDVQQQAVQRPADQFGVGPEWERAGAGVVVLRAVDPAVQLLIAVHLISVAGKTSSPDTPGPMPTSPMRTPSPWPRERRRTR
jgi:hypothetical protein